MYSELQFPWDRIHANRSPAIHSLASGRSADSEPASESLRLLRSEEYAEWDALVDRSPQGCVFCRSWWLNAVGPDVSVLGYFESGRLVAGVPLYFAKRSGFRMCIMPQFTQTWGVVIEPLTGTSAVAMSRESHILAVFAERLKKERVFYQRFHPNLQNWLPFYWNGFQQTARATYVIDDLRDTKQVWENMAANIRTKIRKAEKSGLTAKPCGIDKVFETSVKVFARQGLGVSFSQEYLARLHSAAVANGCGACFAAEDNTGETHATTFLVWDKKRSYYLAGGSDPNLRASGAQSALVWHSIQFAAERTAVFDFEGSMIEPIEQYFRSFGAKQASYHQIVKMPAMLSMYLEQRGKM